MRKGIFLMFVIMVTLSDCYLVQIAREFKDKIIDPLEVESWTRVNMHSNKVQVCKDVEVVTGPQSPGKSSMSKTFNTGVKYNSITVQFDFYIIDSWQSHSLSSEVFVLSVHDRKLYLGSDINTGLHSISENMCGSERFNDRQTRITVTLENVPPQFTVTMECRLNQMEEGWGVRNFEIFGEIGQNDDKLIVDELKPSNFGEANWTFNEGLPPKTYNCGTTKVLGGFRNVEPMTTFQRYLTNLDDHSFLRIKYNAIFIDTNELHDTYLLYVDENIVHEQSAPQLGQEVDLCGTEAGDEKIDLINVRVPHFADSAKIQIFVNQNEGGRNESFGIYNFQVFISNSCPKIYSEYNKGGRQLSFCGDIPVLASYGWTFPIRGIYIPQGLSVEVYKLNNFAGDKRVFLQTDYSIMGKQFVFINKLFNIDIDEQPRFRLSKN